MVITVGVKKKKTAIIGEKVEIRGAAKKYGKQDTPDEPNDFPANPAKAHKAPFSHVS